MLLERCTPFDHREIAAFTGDGEPRTVHRKVFIDAAGGEQLSAWRDRFANTDIFVSLHAYREPRLGAPGVCPCLFDIDAGEDPSTALCQTRRCAELLIRGFVLDPAQLDICFSGRGFHVGLPLQTFDWPDDPRVLHVWAVVARRLVERGCDRIDTGIYDRARLIRVSNSRNHKSGLFKVPLEYPELRDCSLDEIHELASTPRDFDSAACPEDSPKASSWLAAKLEALPKSKRRLRPRRPIFRGWRVPPCVRRIERATLQDGERHRIYYTLARCYAHIGMSVDEAIDRLEEIDSRHPIRDPDYIERTVRNAWEKPGIWGCPNPTLKRFCEPRRCHLPPCRLNGSADGD